MAKKWQPGTRCRTVGDVEVWGRFRKALFIRNINRAKVLRRARVEADLTQEEVAKEIGITGAAYCYWEGGHRNLTTDIVNEAVKAMAQCMRRQGKRRAS